jgi:hypothetical protein
VVVVWLGLALFVLAWVFDIAGIQSVVPLWLPFAIAVGLELQLFINGMRATPARSPSRGRLPSRADRERYGYAGEADELLLVREGGRELWIPYSGERPDEVEALIREVEREAPDEDDDGDEDEPLLDEPPRWRTPLRRLIVGTGVISALAAFVWIAGNRGWEGIDETTRAEATSRFSVEASRIAGKQVEIRCDEAGEYVGAVQHADGVAEVGGRLAYLTPERCYDLYELAFKGEFSSNQTGRALAVLAHEAWHLRGLRDEGVIECYAFQTGVELGRNLGLSEKTARQLMRQQLAENALHGSGNLEYLVPAECKNDGALDLDRTSSAFP